MKTFLIGTIVTILLLVVTNMTTVIVTYSVNDYLWRKHVNTLQHNIEYKAFSAMHRSCVQSLDDNNKCNATVKVIYQLYQKEWNPLPGFDFDLIREVEDEGGA